MKKVLLSLSMFASVMLASAQNQVVLWNSANGATQITGTPFNFGVPGTGNPPTTPPDPVVGPTPVNAGLFVDTVSNVIRANGSCAATKYYVGGFGAASFSAPNVGLPWGTNVTNSGGSMASYYLNLEIKASGATAPKIKVQLSSKDSTNVQGYILDLTTAAGVATANGFKIYSIALGSFSNTIGQYGDPINKVGHYMTKAYADSLYKIEYSVNVGTTTDGSGSVNFEMKNQWISTNKATITSTISSANIGSTVVFPNPAESSFTAQVNLKSSANVSINVSDMMGNVVRTEELGNVVSAAKEINVSGLAKGMYTVTYILDGTPAKAEKIMVK